MRRRRKLRAVTIPADLYAEVEREATRLGVPPAWVVALAVRESLHRPPAAYDQDAPEVGDDDGG